MNGKTSYVQLKAPTLFRRRLHQNDIKKIFHSFISFDHRHFHELNFRREIFENAATAAYLDHYLE